MKRLLLPLLLVAPLSAQNWELGLHGYGQQYPSISTSPTATVEPQQTTAWAGRLGYALVDLGPAMLQLNAVYSPKVDADVKVGGATVATKLSDEYYGAGVMFNFKFLVAFGAGVDYRSEKLTYGTTSTTYGRSWARANIGFAFPLPVVKPFIMVEVAAPLTSESYSSGLNAEDSLKSVAPKLQAGIYAGIRF